MSLDICVWGRRTKDACDAPAGFARLCDVHRGMWVMERYIHGAEPDQRKIRSDGRVEICIDRIWQLEHRCVMARHLGRHLEHTENIVHLDHNRANNDLENLWLTDKSGALAHAKARRELDQMQPTQGKRRFNIDVRFCVEVEEDHELVFQLDDIEASIHTGNEIVNSHIVRMTQIRK